MKIGKLLVGVGMVVGSLTSCKKEDMSQYVKKSDLPSPATPTAPITTETKAITINSYDWTWNSLYNRWEFAISHSYLYDKFITGFVMSGGNQLMPYYDADSGVTYGLVDYTFDSNNPRIIVTYYSGSSTLARPSSSTYLTIKIK